MAVEGAPETIGQIMQMEDDSPIAYNVAVRVTSVMHLVKCRADHMDGAERVVGLKDLPYKDFPACDTKKTQSATLKHVVDIILDVADTFDRESIVALMMVNDYNSLPAPICLKVPIASTYVMNVAILKKPTGSVDVVKHVIFDDPIPTRSAKIILHGSGSLINFGTNTRAGAKPFVYLFHRMGGFQVAQYKLTVGARANRPIERPEDIDAGYDFIMASKRFFTKTNLTVNRFIDKEISREGGPLFGWTVGRVQKSVSDCREADQHAEAETECQGLFSLNGIFASRRANLGQGHVLASEIL